MSKKASRLHATTGGLLTAFGASTSTSTSTVSQRESSTSERSLTISSKKRSRSLISSNSFFHSFKLIQKDEEKGQKDHKPPRAKGRSRPRAASQGDRCDRNKAIESSKAKRRKGAHAESKSGSSCLTLQSASCEGENLVGTEITLTKSCEKDQHSKVESYRIFRRRSRYDPPGTLDNTRTTHNHFDGAKQVCKGDKNEKTTPVKKSLHYVSSKANESTQDISSQIDHVGRETNEGDNFVTPIKKGRFASKSDQIGKASTQNAEEVKQQIQSIVTPSPRKKMDNGRKLNYSLKMSEDRIEVLNSPSTSDKLRYTKTATKDASISKPTAMRLKRVSKLRKNARKKAVLALAKKVKAGKIIIPARKMEPSKKIKARPSTNLIEKTKEAKTTNKPKKEYKAESQLMALAKNVKAAKRIIPAWKIQPTQKIKTRPSINAIDRIRVPKPTDRQTIEDGAETLLVPRKSDKAKKFPDPLSVKQSFPSRTKGTESKHKDSIIDGNDFDTNLEVESTVSRTKNTALPKKTPVKGTLKKKEGLSNFLGGGDRHDDICEKKQRLLNYIDNMVNDLNDLKLQIERGESRSMVDVEDLRSEFTPLTRNDIFLSSHGKAKRPMSPKVASGTKNPLPKSQSTHHLMLNRQKSLFSIPPAIGSTRNFMNRDDESVLSYESVIDFGKVSDPGALVGFGRKPSGDESDEDFVSPTSSVDANSNTEVSTKCSSPEVNKKRARFQHSSDILATFCSNVEKVSDATNAKGFKNKESAREKEIEISKIIPDPSSKSFVRPLCSSGVEKNRPSKKAFVTKAPNPIEALFLMDRDDLLEEELKADASIQLPNIFKRYNDGNQNGKNDDVDDASCSSGGSSLDRIMMEIPSIVY